MILGLECPKILVDFDMGLLQIWRFLAQEDIELYICFGYVGVALLGLNFPWWCDFEMANLECPKILVEFDMGFLSTMIIHIKTD